VVKLYLMRLLGIITTIGAYTMVLLGALVTKTGSGQGCGNTWPFCHGQIIPGTLTIEGVYEYTHRVSSGAGGFLIVALAVWTWLAFRNDRQIKLFGFLSVLFVLIQGALGALTVMFEGTWEKNYILSIHFGVSLICLASVLLLTIRLFQIKSKRYAETLKQAAQYPATQHMQYATWGLALYTYLVTYTGALVRHSNAAMGCGTQFPGCGNTLLPDVFSAAGIQMLHRYAAGSLFLATLLFFVLTLRRYYQRKELVHGSIWAFALIILQALCGMTIVLTGDLMIIALLHTTIIAVFFSILSYLCVQVGWPWRARPRAQVALASQS
jgi:Uncharacterized protein required for cytochrome oxidase assembly